MDRISRTLVQLALEEDLNEVGDLTSQTWVDPKHRSTGIIAAREPAVISGLEVARHVFQSVDSELEFVLHAEDGNAVAKGAPVCRIHGSTRSILTGERTALNFLQRLSGIATIASEYVQRVSHTGARILDTRKTTPGWRYLEKKAVSHGGATNHRMGLYDMVMVKDNHLAASPVSADLESQIRHLKSRSPGLKIEVEADYLDQVDYFLRIEGIDAILLDNMSNADLKKAVSLRNKAQSAVKLEASGGVHLGTVKGIAETGVDSISVGAMTHSVRSIDLGLDLVTDS